MADGTRLLRFEANGKTLQFTFLQNWSDNFGDLVLRSERLPGLTGGFDELGSSAAPSEVGTISASFALVAESKAQMTAQLDDLRAIAEWPKGRLYMQPADPGEGERWCWARLNTITTAHNYERHSDLFMRVQATFQVAYPRWERLAVPDNAPRWGAATWGAATWGGSGWQYVGSAYHEPRRWGGDRPGGQARWGASTWSATRWGQTQYDPPVTVWRGANWGEPGARWGDGSIAPVSQTITLNNDGNADALVRILLSARRHCRGGIVIERVGSDEKIALAPTALGQSWDINTRSLAARFERRDGYAHFTATTPRWLTLSPGANTLRFTFPQGGGINVKVIYSHTWI